MKKRVLATLLAAVLILGLLSTTALAGGISYLTDGERFDFTDWSETHEELYVTIPAAGWYGLTVSPTSVEVEVKISTGGGDSWGEPCPGGWSGNTYYVYLTGVFEEDESSYYYIAIDGEQINTIDVTYYGETLPDGVPDFRDFTVQGSVLSAYNGSGGDVAIPDRVTIIGERAFAYCDSLTSVTIPDSVTTIGEGAFTSCDGLTSVTIPDSVTTIGDEAFAFCNGLTSVTIPDSVTTIGDEAFSFCFGLASISVSINNEQYIAQDGVLFNKNKTELLCYPGGKVGTYIIPDSVTTIGYQAFAGCDGLTSITIPNSVTTIGDEAFTCCNSLTSVTIPDSVTAIGNEAFAGCDGLTSITIPNSVTTIGDGAFAYCDSLTSILVSINNEQYITQDSVLFNKNKTELLCYPGGKVESYIIPDSVTTIGYQAFAGCDGLTSITIPNSVTTIGYGAFASCDGLTSVTIPNSVTTIGYEAFLSCDGLTDVYYGGSEAEWKQIAIESENDALTDVTIHYTEEPPTSQPTTPSKPTTPTTPSQPENPPVEPENPPVEPETPITPASEKFTDVVKGSWYEAGVTYVTDKGLFQGVSEGVFAPQSNMTRAMLMTVLARLDGQDTDGGETWYSTGMDWAKEQGISDGTQPNVNVTREQLVVMLYRYAKSPAADGNLNGYVDKGSVSNWAKDAMVWAVSNGILTGKDGQRLDPQGTATRAEVAAVIQRFVEKLEK